MGINKCKGMTLVELLIVVVVIAIIASIALPSYEQFMQKGRRADGKNAIMQLSALQERFYSENGFYGRMTDLVGTATFDSDKGHYNVAVDCSPDSAACTAASRPQFYTFTATGQGGQANDTKCGNLTFDQSGTKGASGASTTEELLKCW